MDPGLLSGSGAGRGLCPGTVLRPLLPEELPVFLSASLLMLLGFPVLQPTRTLLRTWKRQYKTALCLRLLFSGHGAFL